MAADIDCLERGAEGSGVAVAHPEPIGNRVTERADAELQRAAVLHKRRGVDADRVVGSLRWRIRHAEERMLALRRVHQDVEIVVADLGIREERVLRR